MSARSAGDRWWPLSGRGLENFGEGGKPALRARPRPQAGEIVATVEAATICASDAKMVRLGNDYPLFGGRDLAGDPVCLGHELALRVDAVADRNAALREGTRIGIQPDIYCGGRRMCVGVNIPGGFADALVLDEAVMNSDLGAMAFAVPVEVGRAATAMLEPLACVEGAFRLWGRSRLKPGGRLAVVCADAGRDWRLDMPAGPGSVVLFGLSRQAFERMAPEIACDSIACADPSDGASAGEFDDLIVLGACDEALIGRLFDRLTSGATVTWLSPDPVNPTVKVDLAHFHYGKLSLRGGRTMRLGEVFAAPVRTDYRAGGSTLVFGASGAMGRFHLMRAIEAPNGPRTIVALARRRGKLDRLIDELSPLAARHGRRLQALATEEEGWRAQLGASTERRGFDEVIVVAPGGEAMSEACRHVADDGLLIGFAGTRVGELVDLPIGRIVNGGMSITASSGSTVEDQMRVIDGIIDGEITPERHIAAVCGLSDLHAGMRAVMEGRFSGKVLVLPAVDWPLTPIGDLMARRDDLRVLAHDGKYWSKDIEDVVLGPR